MSPVTSVTNFLRKTPLYDLHTESRGSMVPWQGNEVPSHYKSILEEHKAAVEGLGLFDLGFQGVVRVEGPTAGELIDRLSSCDTLNIAVGTSDLIPFVYPDGTLVDLVRVLRAEEHTWLIVLSGVAREKALTWFRQEAMGSGCWLDDLSLKYSWVGLSGTRAAEYLACGSPTLKPMNVGDVQEALIGGVACMVWCIEKNFYELSCRPEMMPKIIHGWWVGEDRPTLCGWASYENWQLEKGILRQGYEVKEGTSPFEVGLDDKVDLGREHFSGRSALIEEEKTGMRHILVYFTLDALRLPRPKAPLYCADRMVGVVCAGGFSPRLQKPIGSAWVRTDEVDFDMLQLEIRRQRYDLKIKKPPFVS